MSLHGKLNVKIFLMFIVAENTRSVNIMLYNHYQCWNAYRVDYNLFSGCNTFYHMIITDSVVLWKIQKFDLLIPEKSDINVCITQHFAVRPVSPYP